MKWTTISWPSHTTNWQVVTTVLCGMQVASILVFLVGCSGAPSRVSAPKWDPEDSADQAIATLDKDGDGLLTMEELEAAPGLKYCADQIDQDGDKQLSRAEIRDRVKQYQDSRVAYTMFLCKVTYNGRPLPNALVKFVPEPFLGPVVEPAQGTSNRNGQVKLVAENADIPAARIGMYRVEITSSKVKIPEKYNKQSTLGVEISCFTDPNGQRIFNLKSR